MKRHLALAMALAFCFAAYPFPASRAQGSNASGKRDVIITVDPCHRRMHKGCWSARKISRYGAKTYWEVVYVVVDGKWILGADADYGAALDDRCGKEGFAYLKTVAPVEERRVPALLAAAQDVKEKCELDQIRADGLAAVDKALGVNAASLDDFHVLRLAKADFANAPPQAQAMLAPWIKAQAPS